MWDDDPPPRPPIRDATGDMTLTERVIEDEVRRRLKGRGGRLQERQDMRAPPPRPVVDVQADKVRNEPPPPLPNHEVIALVRRISTGKYVHVEKLIEALST